MANAIYHKSSKGRPAYIIKDGERLATFLQQPTYENGVRMAWALSDEMGISVPVSNQPITLEHGTAQPVRDNDSGDAFAQFAQGLIGRHVLVTVRKDPRHNPRSLSHRPLGDDEFYTAHNVKL